MLRELDLPGLVAVCNGFAQHNGWIRYFTNAEMWGGRIFLFLHTDVQTCRILTRSSYDEPWVREQIEHQTAVGEIESTLTTRKLLLDRAVEIVSDLTGGSGRIGVLRIGMLTADEQALFQRTLPHVELVDVTDRLIPLRLIKSRYEIAAIQETAETLTRGMELFAARARPGRSALEVAGEVDGFFRGQGCLWGRVGYSLDQRPVTLPVPLGRRFAPDDVILFQCVQSGRSGYWWETARVYSFQDMPAAALHRLQVAERALKEAARHAVPGNTYGGLLRAVEAVFAAEGLRMAKGRRLACQPMGTEENEAETILSENWQFKENMVLALHPSAILDDHGFLLGGSYLVQSGGAVPVAPGGALYQRLETV